MAEFLTARLSAVERVGRLRTLAGAVEGVDFWSNDYLGLGAGAQVRGEVKERGLPAGPGSTGSRSISGDHPAYHALEARIAAYHGQAAALVFNAGYTANLGLLSALLRRTDTIVYDELVHASCRDGIRLGQAKAYRFRHNDLDDLRRQVARARPDGQVFVLTEGRFSMDGDVAPLAEMAGLCRAASAHLIVDEAHSAGLDGAGGAGLVVQLGLAEEVFATVVTYGKAFGTHGAAVLGSVALREYLINTARPFIYSTAPAPAQWSAIAAAYDRMEARHAEQIALLTARVADFHAAVNAAGLRAAVPLVHGPIQTVRLPGNEAVMAAEAACRTAGLLVKGIRSPTVKAGEERLRICLHSFNTAEELGALVGRLAALESLRAAAVRT